MVKIVVVGGGIAGINAATAAKKVDENAEVTIFGSESEMPYYRPLLTEFIADRSIEKKNSFLINQPVYYQNKGIELKNSVKITKINTGKSLVVDDSGETYSYDKLILATGSKPFVPFKNFNDLDFVFTLRTYKDAVKISNYAEKSNKITIIGGGAIGLETAWAMCRLGKKVKIVEVAERLLPKQLDAKSSDFLINKIESHGIEIFLQKSLDKIETRDSGKFVVLTDGTEFETDCVILSLGVRAETELAKECGIAVDRGILINEKCGTSISNIYACGDAAQFGTVPALMMPAIKTGSTAGTNAAGGDAVFTPDIYQTSINAFGIKLSSFGEISGCDYSRTVEKNGIVKTLCFKESNICGGIVFNDQTLALKIISTLKKGDSAEKVLKEFDF